jgi:hypothetical protein
MSNDSRFIKFIEKAKLLHGDLYSYEKTDYIDSHTHIIIICAKHGDFSQTPSNHLRHGCILCGRESMTLSLFYTTEMFIDKAKKIHGENKYDYTLVDYKSNIEKVNIICPTHGVFLQTSKLHLKGGGCTRCAYEAKGVSHKKGLEHFIEKSRRIHGDRYDYSLVNYERGDKNVTIICPQHGEFLQRPTHHYEGRGCKKCAGEQQSARKNHSLEKFIELANLIHINFYSYENSVYINNTTNIIITCPIHGDFEQSPANHKAGYNCRSCGAREWGKPSKGEREIAELLDFNQIQFEFGKSFHDCRNPETGNHLYFDFYIPSLNIIVEYDGQQHFKPVIMWGGEDGLKKQIERDSVKNNYCFDNEIPLIRIPYDESVSDTLLDHGIIHTLP